MLGAILMLALVGPSAETAPPPRPACTHRGSPECLCPDGDLRCRARAALTLAAAAKSVQSPEQAAAKKALAQAETKIKASKPSPRADH